MKLYMIIKNDITKKILIFFLAFLAVFAIMLSSLITKKYDIKEGDIAKVDIKAPREVLDKASTEEKKKQASDAIGPQYTLNTEVETDADAEIDKNFAQINNIRNMNIDTKLKDSMIDAATTYKFSEVNTNTLASASKDDISSLQAFINKTLRTVFSKGIKQGSSDDLKTAQDYVNSQFNNSKFSKEIIDVGILIAKSYINPNLYLDEQKQNDLKEEAGKKIQSVIIKKDQIIVKEGEPVTKEQIEVLQDLGLLNNNTSSNWYIYLSLAAFIIIVMMTIYYYLYKYRKDLFLDNSKLILIFLLNTVALILARTISVFSPFLIPLSCVPILLCLLIDKRASLVISTLNCLLICAVVEFNIQIILLAVLSSVLTSVILKKMHMRNGIMNSAILIAAVNTMVTFSVGILLSNNILDIIKISGLTFLGGCLSAILTIGFLPILESTFDIVTTVKLLELSNPNNELLKRLLMEAPGTYHHSIIVANLAEVAAEEVGGNPVLARVAAYYHDVGKIQRPYFFKENQIGMENPHDKIEPKLSTLVIISHVKDGIELAKEYKLPKIIQDIIKQHHGTTIVKYFYIISRNSSENPDAVNPEEFKYPGPVPESKECAIIMLADSIEAAVRSIQQPTKDKVKKMVDNIFNDRLSTGQLDNCELTLKDIHKVKESFLKTLTGVYHQRIEYPDDKTQGNKQS